MNNKASRYKISEKEISLEVTFTEYFSAKVKTYCQLE